MAFTMLAKAPSGGAEEASPALPSTLSVLPTLNASSVGVFGARCPCNDRAVCGRAEKAGSRTAHRTATGNTKREDDGLLRPDGLGVGGWYVQAGTTHARGSVGGSGERRTNPRLHTGGRDPGERS